MRKGYSPSRLLLRWLARVSGLVFLAVIILVISLVFRPITSRSAPPSPEIRSATLNPIVAQGDNSGIVWGLSLPKAGDTGFTLKDGATWGIYNSPIYQADFAFNAMALSWKAQLPAGADIVVEARASADGRQWTEWFKVEALDGASSEGGQYHSQLIVAQGRYIQYSITLYAVDPDVPPSLKDVKVTYIDSSEGPSVTKAQGVGPSRRPSEVPQPTIISRAGWGSPEPNSSDRWPPEYRQWRKVALHDTVTKNNDPNPAATVRAIWYYHANTLGWGDIGYNYLIDTFGNIYEGRFGGDNATGGHVLSCYNPGSIGVALLGDYRYAEVTPAMSNALETLMAAKTYQHNIEPMGAGNFGGTDYKGVYWQLWLNNIFAHRDLSGSCGNNHTDPGTYAYDRFQEFRNDTWNMYPMYSEIWVDHNSPQRMKAGSTTTVAVTVKNTGRSVWTSSNLFRLGYRWYGQDGAEVFQSGGGFQRAEIPQDIPFGQTVMINAEVTAPASAGAYTLQWDMVQEGVTWFADHGNAPINVNVVIDEPTYGASFAGQSQFVRFFPGDRREVWFELRNTGTAVWYRTGPNPVRLGTWAPADRNSSVATPGDWPNPARATYLDQEMVLPGEVGRFTFLATAPQQPGVYREHFNVVAEGKTWFGVDMYLDFTVLPSKKSFFPGMTRGYQGSW